MRELVWKQLIDSQSSHSDQISNDISGLGSVTSVLDIELETKRIWLLVFISSSIIVLCWHEIENTIEHKLLVIIREGISSEQHELLLFG